MAAWDRARRAVRGHPLAADAAVAVAAYTVTLVTTLGSLRSPAGRLSVTEIVVAGLTCGALLLRRRRPLTVLALTTGGAATCVALSPAHGWALAAPLIALYSAADATGRRRALLIGWLAVLVVGLTHAVGRPVPWFGLENLTLIALGGLAVAAGDASRSRRAYVAEVEERARCAERDRARDTARRVTEERLRIARDLHDSLGHHLALINVQAGAAAAVLDTEPARAREAVRHIGQASRAALDELGHTVGLLRGPGDSAAPSRPAGLAGLDDLITSFGRAGLRIEHEIDGEARPLSPAADITAYRVIEESLTNVRRHAGNVPTRILLAYGSTALRIVIENEANGENEEDRAREDDERHPAHAAAARAGYGLAGMRERVMAGGGHVHAGPRPGGGFRVSALLPWPDGGASR